ncbi:LPP20 family lipoprotein [Paraglaciecola sp. 25GB23A]|jgi:outer membrane protein FlgP|uniref:LPP20 family lipoprotein n=1 Tax=Paraglaciecola sp. 25GB23A TaxID=3156068 RepID=UPI0032AF9F41|tara:strand:- start:6051 stop:6515 length:465 start_codon:yes stop_codon:yes gene_type:complete
MNNTLKITCLVFTLATTSCSSLFTKQVEWETIEPSEYPVIKAVGYAPISAQKGQNEAGKMLMALKASKLDAYRELAEQVFGQKIDGEQSLQNLVMDDARLNSSVQGVIRGAKVTKSYAVGNDTYATELELDFKLVHDLYLSTAKPQRVKKVRYY